MESGKLLSASGHAEDHHALFPTFLERNADVPVVLRSLPARAAEWCSPMAPRQVRDAAVEVAVWLMHQGNTEKLAGVTLFRELSSGGNELARVNLAWALFKGEGCDRDACLAWDLLYQATRSNCRDAVCLAHVKLAELWAEFSSVPRRDISQLHYEAAARLGNSDEAFDAGLFWDTAATHRDP